MMMADAPIAVLAVVLVVVVAEIATLVQIAAETVV